MAAIRFIAFIIWLGFFLGVIDRLADVTELLANKAAKAHETGLISYGKYSRLLTNTK